MASTNQHVAQGDATKRLKSLAGKRPLEHGGPVAEAIRHGLLDAHKSYEQIAEEVRKALPEASTTARSVASVVRGLRKMGYKVPERRHN